MEQERDRLKHLLTILLEVISSSTEESPPNRARVQEKAAAAGLDEEDVHGLLDWIESQWHLRAYPEWRPEPVPSTPSRSAVRVFVDSDTEGLTPTALRYLLRLQQEGQISRLQFEAMVHYSSLVAMVPLEQEDLEMIIEQVVFRPQRPGMTGGISEGPADLH